MSALPEEPPFARDGALVAELRALGRPLRNLEDLDPLLERIGAASCVMIGEASHGSADFYRWRAAFSARLIREKGFSFVAVEGDWPDCQRIDRYVRARPGSGSSAREVLRGFGRWPTWMWANAETAAFAEWLRRYNEELPPRRRAGFHGLDVYSLWDSLYRVAEYLHAHARGSLPAALRAFECFEPYGEDLQEYARATRWVDASCEAEVVELLSATRRAAQSAAAEHDRVSEDEARFDAEQNALVVRNAERYYRTLVRGGPESWNLRDRHMFETHERLMRHYGPQARGISWAHNTHVGDARFTDMAGYGMINIGQLAREQRGEPHVVLVGFGSFQGSVIAAREWGADGERMSVPPARDGSWEDLLHRTGAGDIWLLPARGECSQALLQPRGQRAIGVVYRPESEAANYVPTLLPRRYDAFLHLDSSQALHPLHGTRALLEGDVPETFPFGV